VGEGRAQGQESSYSARAVALLQVDFCQAAQINRADQHSETGGISSNCFATEDQSLWVLKHTKNTSRKTMTSSTKLGMPSIVLFLRRY